MSKDAFNPKSPGIAKRAFGSISVLSEENRTIEISFSSENPIDMGYIVEILSHEQGAADLTRLNSGAPLLFNHDRCEHIGIVESARIAPDRKGRAIVRFGNSELATEKWDDVRAGILVNVSFAYSRESMVLVEETDDKSTYRTDKWTATEISFVTVPADITVGVNRSLTEADDSKVIEPGTSDQREPGNRELQPKEQEAAKTLQTPVITGGNEQRNNKESNKMSTENKDITKEIAEAGQRFNAPDLALRAIQEGKTLDQFQSMLLEHRMSEAENKLREQNSIGIDEKEAKRFSFVKLLRHLADPSDKKIQSESGFEIEICRAMAEKSNKAGRTSIPNEVLLASRADAIISNKTAAGYTNIQAATVATQLAPTFIDLLRNNSVILQRATIIEGLTGFYDMSKQLTGIASTYIGEDDAAAKEDITFGLINFRPKTCSARAEVTRRQIMTNSFGAEQIVRNDLAKAIALGVDRGGWRGTGTGNEPKGLLNHTLSAVTWTTANAPKFSELVQLETEVMLDNYDQVSTNLAYYVGAGIVGYAKSAPKFGTGTEATIWEAGGTINGYPVIRTNQLLAGEVVFGDLSQLAVAMWGSLDLIVDTMTHSDRGRIRISAFQDVDFGVMREAAFALGKNA